MLVDILLGVSVLLNILLFIGVKNLLKQNEQLEDLIITERNQVIEKVNNALQNMREVDLRGSFESDDEVGSTFEQLKSIIEELYKGV